ncbi:hypothetical protein LA303_02525 [Candidatus Sulfidibacterium hydrothermale]|uniref:hypothetical protein n=1 Tax=Candidatus Sulfidibacterium hydrothermale TaxID=2875962 RepID=UPI001F0AC9A8|nr:hypothetical protein [Candidatus Sulfidibacterium hydrothermale]UBM62864.1 hypothetical protein LA303_02525 [Candidatus Sulfidibacterium hydrothermale]
MRKHIPLLLMVVAISVFLSRCATSSVDFVTSQYDQVKKEKRIRMRITFPYVRERYTTFYSLQKDILKIIKANGETQYQVFDRLNVSIDSYPLSDTVFLIADNQAYPIVVRHRKTEIFHHPEVEKSQVRKNDSTTVSVISGVNEKEYKSIQFQYPLTRQEVNALQHADSASFQYYANPDVYKLKLSYYTLKRLKKFFAKQ